MDSTASSGLLNDPAGFVRASCGLYGSYHHFDIGQTRMPLEEMPLPSRISFVRRRTGRGELCPRGNVVQIGSRTALIRKRSPGKQAGGALENGRFCLRYTRRAGTARMRPRISRKTIGARSAPQTQRKPWLREIILSVETEEVLRPLKTRLRPVKRPSLPSRVAMAKPVMSR
jgi:hypothetical protein